MADSYPSTLWKFLLWAKAMERGATVGKPAYKGKAGPGRTPRGQSARRKRLRRRSRKGKKED